MKTVAAIITEYRNNSHADVIVGKILDGFHQDGGPGPDLKLASMFLDQFPESDMAREKAKQHQVPIFKNIEQAITLDQDKVAVDGVLIIGEHGRYPYNVKQQHMYPRPRLFEDVVATFKKFNQVVPVFNDKHLAYNWHNASWMYETVRDMQIPFMAGSSLPVAWRKPALLLPRGCEIEEAMAVGYGSLEAYGFHMLETLQCQVERRQGGETGVSWVESAQGQQIFNAENNGRWSRPLLEALMQSFPENKRGDLKKKLGESTFYLMEYRDGLKASGVMLPRHSEFGFAAKLKGEKSPVACWFGLQAGKPFFHFAHLVQAIDQMLQTGHQSYPAERTLLTTGVLDAAMTSLFENGRRQETPHLKINYEAIDYPFSPGEPPFSPGP